MTSHRRRSRGQSSIEFALIAPLLFLLLLGASDLAQGFYLSIETNGAARAGMRDGVQSDTVDLGDAVRSEPNTAIPCTVAVWGQEFAPCLSGGGTGTPGAYADCAGATQSCGDPQGCDAVHSTFWTTPGPGTTALPSACFAVQSCTKTGTAGAFSCTYNPAWNSGKWQTRPTACSAGTCTYNGVVIKVVYKYTPSTPLIAAFVAGTGGSFYLTQIVIGMQVY
jgi:hypothetical protein